MEQVKSPLGWAFEPIRRYADFSGRSRRREYWWFFLLQLALHILFAVVIFSLIGGDAASDLAADSRAVTATSVGILAIVWLIVTIGLIVPNAAVVVRRCHDNGIPGIVGGLCYAGMYLISFIGIAVLVMMLIEGKVGRNEFGSDPRGDDVGNIFA